MIKNDKQLKVAEKQLQSLKDTLVCSLNTTVEMPQDIYEAMIQGILSQIYEMQVKIREFKAKQ